MRTRRIWTLGWLALVAWGVLVTLPMSLLSIGPGLVPGVLVLGGWAAILVAMEALRAPTRRAIATSVVVDPRTGAATAAFDVARAWRKDNYPAFWLAYFSYVAVCMFGSLLWPGKGTPLGIHVAGVVVACVVHGAAVRSQAREAGLVRGRRLTPRRGVDAKGWSSPTA